MLNYTKLFIKAALILLISTGISSAAPDGSFRYRFTNRSGETADNIVTFAPGAATAINNTSLSCISWQLTYSSEGFSALSITLQTAPAGITIAGAPTPSSTWSTFGGTATAGSLAMTSTSQGNYVGYGFYPYLRVNVTTTTGTGSIEAKLTCWTSITYANTIGSGGGGSSITAGFGLTLTGSEMAADPAVVATQSADNTFVGRQDSSGASSTAPVKIGTSTPATCVVGDLYVKTNATATNVLYACTATNTWTAQGGGTKPNDIYRTFAVSCGNGASGSVIPMWFNPVTTGSGSQCNDSGEGHAYVDNGGSAKVIIPYRLPSDFDGSTLNLSLVTRNGETATETLSVETSCLASGGDWDSPSFNTAQTWTQAYTSGETVYTSKSGLTLTGCSAGSLMYVRFKSTAGSNFLLIMEATFEAGRA
jgi:hypothetical protein